MRKNTGTLLLTLAAAILLLGLSGCAGDVTEAVKEPVASPAEKTAETPGVPSESEEPAGESVAPMPDQPEGKKFFVLYVRGNPDYGKNSFIDNKDGTVTDAASGLMWSQSDSSEGLDWGSALEWVQKKNNENYLGYSDWRLPDAKEMQSIVDYSRSPDTTGSAAIDPVFEVSEITNEAGQKDYPYYWTGTTHMKANGMGDEAVYIAFGRASGYMFNEWLDVHGAGAQRSDPKSGDPGAYPFGHGPQGDAIRIFNYVRLVRNAE